MLFNNWRKTRLVEGRPADNRGRSPVVRLGQGSNERAYYQGRSTDE